MPIADLLIPVRKLQKRRGVFRWPRQAVLAGARPADLLPLRQLAGDLKAAGGTARVEGDIPGLATVRIRREEKIRRPETYRIHVTPAGVEILASGDAGAYYAVQTLRDLLAVHAGREGGAPRLPCCLIDDSPDFARRGVCYDCSRGKVPTLDTLRALVERLARWKINELQLYVEDVFSFRRHPLIGRGESPFTAREILALQEHCKLHHMRLVGCLASFGHLEKILRLPPYKPLAETDAPGSTTLAASGATTLCPTDPCSIRLVEELFGEFVPLFKADDFNVCCDETTELGRGRTKKLAARVGVGRVYLDFLLKIHRLCRKHGKRMNAWADIVLEHPDLLSELPKDIVMLNWSYDRFLDRIPRTKEIRRAGLPFMVCPGTSSWQAHGSRLPNAMGNVRRFAAEGRRQGAEGLLNTDWGDFGHRNLLGASLHGFAHGAAHAWNGAAVNERKFTDTFCFHAFGARNGTMADALRELGSTYLTCGGTHRNWCVLYHALVEPLEKPTDASPERDWIGTPTPKGLREVISQLADFASRMPALPRSADVFKRLAIEELKLAARVDILASRRALAGQAIRAGRVVPAAELKKLAADTASMSRRFEKLWLARNKPSRLKDNLRAFAAAGRNAPRFV